MRVVVVTRLRVGDFTRSDAARRLPLALAARHETTLVASDPCGAPELAEALAGNVVVRRGAGGGLRWAMRAARVAAEGRPDAIVCGIDEPTLLAGALAARATGAPVVAVCEDHPFMARYREPGALARVERAARVSVLRRLVRRADRLACFIHPGVLDFLGIGDAKIARFRNSCDMESLAPIRDRARAAGPLDERERETIGYVGVVSEDKGAFEMLEVLRLASARRPTVRLRLIGAIEPAFERALRERARRDGTEARIETTGLLPWEEALARAARCAVCLHAYRPLPWLHWNQPLKICEYLATGRPVVAFDRPGTRDLLGGSDAGILVPDGDPGAMAEAATRILDDTETRARMEAAAGARADELSWERTEAEFDEMLVRLASERRGPATR